MDTTATLAQIVRHQVELYGDTETLKAKTYSFSDEVRQIYGVIVVPNPDHPMHFPARADVMAQVVGEKVIILEDRTDKPLYEALMINGGIPREQIILAYAGEALPAPE